MNNNKWKQEMVFKKNRDHNLFIIRPEMNGDISVYQIKYGSTHTRSDDVYMAQHWFT